MAGMHKVLQLKVKQIQNHGMRLILSKLYRMPSEEMRKSLKFPTLVVERRKRFRLAMVHRNGRYLNGPSLKALQGLFERNKEKGTATHEGLRSSTSSQTRLNEVEGHLQPVGHGSEISCLEQPDRPTPHGLL